jgi:copper resistance protein C
MKIPSMILSLMLTFFPLYAFSHTGLQASTPASGAVLTSTPPRLELAFSAPVRLMTLTLETTGGKTIPLKAPSQATPKTDFSLDLPTLDAGGYRAHWTVMGGDAHKMSGTITFTLSGQ